MVRGGKDWLTILYYTVFIQDTSCGWGAPSKYAENLVVQPIPNNIFVDPGSSRKWTTGNEWFLVKIDAWSKSLSHHYQLVIAGPTELDANFLPPIKRGDSTYFLSHPEFCAPKQSLWGLSMRTWSKGRKNGDDPCLESHHFARSLSPSMPSGSLSEFNLAMEFLPTFYICSHSEPNSTFSHLFGFVWEWVTQKSHGLALPVTAKYHIKLRIHAYTYPTTSLNNCLGQIMLNHVKSNFWPWHMSNSPVPLGTSQLRWRRWRWQGPLLQGVVDLLPFPPPVMTQWGWVSWLHPCFLTAK